MRFYSYTEDNTFYFFTHLLLYTLLLLSRNIPLIIGVLSLKFHVKVSFLVLKFCSHSSLKIFLITFTLKYHFLLYLKFHVQNYYFFITLKRVLYCLLSCSWEDWCQRLIKTQRLSKMSPGFNIQWAIPFWGPASFLSLWEMSDHVIFKYFLFLFTFLSISWTILEVC